MKRRFLFSQQEQISCRKSLQILPHRNCRMCQYLKDFTPLFFCKRPHKNEDDRAPFDFELHYLLIALHSCVCLKLDLKKWYDKYCMWQSQTITHNCAFIASHGSAFFPRWYDRLAWHARWNVFQIRWIFMLSNNLTSTVAERPFEVYYGIVFTTGTVVDTGGGGCQRKKRPL